MPGNFVLSHCYCNTVLSCRDLDEALEMGMDWSLREGYVWAEDKEHCEEYGRMLNADPSVVSTRAKKRGLPQLGTLGAGNHYAEIQVVDEIYDKWAASKMGIETIGQVLLCMVKYVKLWQFIAVRSTYLLTFLNYFEIRAIVKA